MAGTHFEPLRTPRLILRRLVPSDAPALAAYRNDPRVARYQSWTEYSPQRAISLIESQASVVPGTPGAWMQLGIVTADSGELIGDCGLHFLAAAPGSVELGITLAAPHHGRGYASEVVSCITDYLFARLGKHRVVATIDAKNGAAAALFERAGFHRQTHLARKVWFKDEWGEEWDYELLVPLGRGSR